ncbi:glycosyltransferase, partial [Caulobacter sp. 17J80-11]|uniref:glycosyltransferase n=1 Tax=Caulobacter sp. 17J80-11 TaxID=2763502 RepID=UPI001653B425
GLELAAAGLPSIAAHDRPGETRFAADVLADLAAAAHADLVQLDHPALACSERFTAPVIVAAAGCAGTWWSAMRSGAPIPDEDRWRSELARDGYGRCAAAVAPTAAFAAAVAETYGRRPIVVRGGRRAAIAPAAEPAADPFVLAVGRLWDAGDEMETLDRAATRVQAPVVALGPVLGPRGERTRFARLSAPGPLDPVRTAQLLRERPIYASAARYAPDAPGALAAGQAGCALVLSDVPAHRELWSGAALFFAPGDADGCAAAINRLLADPNLRAERGGAARARAGRYSADAMTRGMLGVYRSVTGGPDRRPARRTASPRDLSVALG